MVLSYEFNGQEVSEDNFVQETMGVQVGQRGDSKGGFDSQTDSTAERRDWSESVVPTGSDRISNGMRACFRGII